MTSARDAFDATLTAPQRITLAVAALRTILEYLRQGSSALVAPGAKLKLAETIYELEQVHKGLERSKV